jgi:hypothetical protein
VADPKGATFALVQRPPPARGMVWGETGSVSWAECLSHHPAVSRRFDD